jgi:hypothetical protein
MTSIEENLAHAAHCFRMAEWAATPNEREEWGHLAKHWLERALHDAEGELTIGVFATK